MRGIFEGFVLCTWAVNGASAPLDAALGGRLFTTHSAELPVWPPPLITSPASQSSHATFTLVRRLIRRVQPSALAFTPREGGRHLVRLGQLAHNKWWGSLVIVVAGDPPAPR